MTSIAKQDRILAASDALQTAKQELADMRAKHQNRVRILEGVSPGDIVELGYKSGGVGHSVPVSTEMYNEFVKVFKEFWVDSLAAQENAVTLASEDLIAASESEDE